jgi:hypothetical protein
MQRITCYGANSSILAQHNYVNEEMNLMLLHNSASSYLDEDASIMMGVGAQFTPTGTTVANLDIVLPLPLSVFQSATQNFPAMLLSAPLTIQIDLSSVARGFFAGSGATITEYSIENSFLLYQAVELPSELIAAERSAVKSSPFVMSCTNTMAVQVQQSVLTSYTLGLNASSVRGVAILPSNAANPSVATQLQYVRYANDSVSGTNSSGNGVGVNSQVYLDGNLANSNIVDNVANHFWMLKQFIHHNCQGSILQPSASNVVNVILNPTTSIGPGVSSYAQQCYAIGFDLSNYDEESTIFGGSPCTNLNLQITGQGNNGTFLATILVLYDVLVAFGEDGSVSIKR